MKTKQLALDALKRCIDEIGPEHDGTDFESECTECWTAKQAREAIAALEADIAQPVASKARAIMRLADAYAEASFDQGLNRVTVTEVPEDRRKELLDAVNALSTPQEPAAPEWIAVSEKLLDSQPEIIFGRLWIATEKYGVFAGRYEWRQGRYPHCFIADTGENYGIGHVTGIMPFSAPKQPKATP